MKQGDFSKELIEEFTQLLPQGLRQAELGPELLGGLNAYKQVKEQGIEAGELFKSYYEIQDVVQRYKEALATGQEQYVTPGTWKQVGKRIIDQYKTVVQAGLMDKVKDQQAKQFISGMGWIGDILQSGKAFSEQQVSLLEQTNLLMLKKGMGSTVATYTKGIGPAQLFYFKGDRTFLDFIGHMFSQEQNTMIAGQKKGQPPVLAQMMQQLSQEPEDQQQMAEIFGMMFDTLQKNTVNVIQQTLGLDEQSVQQKLGNLEGIFLMSEQRFKAAIRNDLILSTVEKLTGASRSEILDYLEKPWQIYTRNQLVEQKKRFLQLLPGWLTQFQQSAQYALGKAGIEETQGLYYNKLLFTIGRTHFFTTMFLKHSASEFTGDWIKKGTGQAVPLKGNLVHGIQDQYLKAVTKQGTSLDPKKITKLYKQAQEEVSAEIGEQYDKFISANILLSSKIREIVQNIGGTTKEDIINYLSFEQPLTEGVGEVLEQAGFENAEQLREFSRALYKEVYVPLSGRLNQFGLPALQSEVVISPYIKGKLVARPILEQSLRRGSKLLASTQDFVIRQGKSSEQLLKLSAQELIAKGQNTELSEFEYRKVLANFLDKYQPYQRQGYRGLKLGGQPKVIGPLKQIYSQQASFSKQYPALTSDVLKYGPFNIQQARNIERQLAIAGQRGSQQYQVAKWILNPTKEFSDEITYWNVQQRMVQQVRQQLTGQTEYAPFIKGDVDKYIQQMIDMTVGVQDADTLTKLLEHLGFRVQTKDVEGTVQQSVLDSLKQITELIDFDILKQITGISDIKVHFGGMLSARIAGAQSLDRIAIQSPNRIGSMIAFKRAGQEFSPLKYLLQAGGQLDEFKRTIGSNIVEAANVLISPRRSSAKKLAKFLEEFQGKQSIDLSKLQPDVDLGFTVQGQELKNVPTVFPALMMSEEGLQKLLSRVGEATGHVPYSFAGDQVFSTISARRVLGYTQMTQKGQKVKQLPKQYKLTGFGREKGMVRELPIEITAVLTTQEGKEIQVPILFVLGSQRSRLNKFSVQVLGSVGQQKFLGYNVPEWTGEVNKDIQNFLKQGLMAGPNLRPQKLIIKAGKKPLEVTDINQLFIAHRSVINLSQDFGSAVAPTRQVQLQSQLTGLLSGYEGIFSTPYPGVTLSTLSKMEDQINTIKYITSDKRDILFSDIPIPHTQFAGQQSASYIDEAKQFAQYKQTVSNMLKTSAGKLSAEQLDILKQTIAAVEIMERASVAEYVKQQGRFVTFEELKSVEYQEQLFEQIQRTGGASIYIGQTQSGSWLTMQLSDIFFRSDTGGGERLVLSDIGNRLRKYFLAVGQFITGKQQPNVYTQLSDLQAQMSSQLARQYFKKSGLYVVGRFSTLADYTDEALKAMEGQQAKDAASLIYAKGQQMPQARMRQLMSLIKSTLAEYKTKNISKEKLTMQLTYAQQVRYIRAEGSKLIVEVPELAKEAVAEEEIIKSVKELLEGEVEVQYVPWERSLETALQALTEIQPRKGFGVARAGKASAFQFMTREPQLTYRPLVRIQYIDESEYIGVPQKIAQLMGGDDDQDIVSQLPSIFIDNDVLRQKQQTNPRLAQVLTQGQIDIPTSQAIFQSLYARGKKDDAFMQQLKSLFRRGG